MYIPKVIMSWYKAPFNIIRKIKSCHTEDFNINLSDTKRSNRPPQRSNGQIVGTRILRNLNISV